MRGTAYLVYDADGGILGEASYFIRKWLGLAKCDLCTVTHDGFRTRKVWVSAITDVDVEIVPLHRNELDGRLRRFVGRQFPCVVGDHKGELRWILRPEQIEPYTTEPERLAQTIAEHFEAPLAPA